jgi:predicted dehydrogenase
MLRWAILGTGFISNTVVDAIALSTESRVDMIAGRNADRVAAFAATHDIARTSVGYDDAINDPEIDAVYIGTPNHQHHHLVIAAAAAGKAVLSEKALTTTMASAHELTDAVRDRVFFVEGLMYLAHPLYTRFVELLSDDQIGTITAVHGRYAANIAHLVNPLGRGTIYNIGCYPASLLQLTIQTAFGEEAFAHRTMSGAGTLTTDGTVGSATASIKFANGVLASLSSTDDYGMAHHFSVLTTRGELRFDTNPWLPTARDNILTWTPYEGEVEAITVTSEHDAFFHQIKLVERGVAAGRTEAMRPSPQLRDSLEIMDLLTNWEAHCLT